MFEFLFKYPATVFSKGTFVLLGAWPHWILFAAIAIRGRDARFLLWRARNRLVPAVRGGRALALWALQSALIALLLLLLWEPAVSVTTLNRSRISLRL